MSYGVELSKPATRTLDRMDRSMERRVRERIKLLAQDLYDQRISKRLVNMGGMRSSRVGRWRILYIVTEVTEAELTVYVIDVRPRGQAYR